VGVVVLPALGVGRKDEVVDAERLRPCGAAHLAHHPARTFAREMVDVHDVEAHRYIRKTPNVVSGIGAFSAAEIPRARTRRVSSGSMIPSSQSRAVEW
jgi:hypothetical protein